jgi:hypothetical protein
MDALTLIRLRYQEQYQNQLAVLEALTNAQARTRPDPVLNSPIWLLWHLARTEDWYVNRFVVDQPQVLEQDDWLPRLGIAETRVGTAMHDDEVGDITAQLDRTSLRAYREAVHDRTGVVLDGLQPDELDQLLDPNRLARLFAAADGFGERAATLAWAEPVLVQWRQRPRGWFLSQATLIHPATHIGELRAVASLLGWRGGI